MVEESSSKHCHQENMAPWGTKVLSLNGGRRVQGILWGFDPFMNFMIDECVEMATSVQQNSIEMVVMQGNSIFMLEALEHV
ncbi:small nuclear ribonucleoprotein G-like [Marmota marmota marmota]|uniref:small nuclear ribonucleoprotein G-like n=1 Tax=Marmota marmota marmota TaxID=9994 RepID=UPI002092598F|nr:small nuclear ribonucleoprotein G-like [Marmota marmota marmota]